MSGSDHRAAVCHLHTPTPKCFWAPGSPTANNEAQAWWLDLLSHSLEAQNSLAVPSSKRSSLRMTNSPILPSIQEAAEKSTSLAQRLSLSEAVTVASYDVTTPNDEMLQLGSTFSCGTSCATTTVTTPADELGGVMSSNVYSSLEQIMLDETTGVMGSYFLPRNYLPAHHLNKANSAFEGLANGALKHDKESHNSGQIHKEPVITIVEKSLSVKSSTKVKDLSESKSDTSATTISRLASPTETCVPHGVSEKQLNNPLSCKTGECAMLLAVPKII
ncbi:hypothetical protein BDF19DRAFT_38652 [Syncephalis fuscata]|nr:hypothetical protein BDF19DRAFT_38652 [Syncephalis fuscata]